MQNVHTLREDPKVYIIYSESRKPRPLYHYTTRELDIFCVERLHDEYLTSLTHAVSKPLELQEEKKKKERFIEMSVKLSSSAKWIKCRERLIYTEKV